MYCQYKCVIDISTELTEEYITYCTVLVILFTYSTSIGDSLSNEY